MAPKRRGSCVGATVPTGRRSIRRTAREPSPSSSSTSSSTPVASPSSTQVDKLAGKVITTGRKVDFELFESEGFQIGRQIKEMGWEKICSLDIPTYPALVKEFYGDLSRGDGGLVSFVRGTRVSINSESLGNLLEMPTIGTTACQHDDRGGALSRMLGREVSELEEIIANQLNLELRLLHNICGRVLFPKIGRFDYVSERDILLMDCILTGQPVNLASMMIGYMAETATKRRSTLPYGMVLTLVFRSQGVRILENEPKRLLRYTDYYTISTIHRMGFKKVNGEWIRKGQEGREGRIEDDIPGPSEAGPSEAGPSASAAAPSAAAPSAPPAAAPADTSPPHIQFVPAPEPMEFTDRQLDQIRALLAEHDSQRREEMKEISDKLDMITSSLDRSAAAVSTELQKVVESLNGVAERSKVYLDANGKLRREIDFAVDQINTIIDGFKDSQKNEFQEVIGHLRRIVFKYT